MSNLTNITNNPPVWLTNIYNVTIYQDTVSGYYFIIPTTNVGTLQFKIPKLTNFGGFVVGGGGGGGASKWNPCAGTGGGGGGSYLYNIYNTTVDITGLSYFSITKGSGGVGGITSNYYPNGENGNDSQWTFSNENRQNIIFSTGQGGTRGYGNNPNQPCNNLAGMGGWNNGISKIGNILSFPTTNNQTTYSGGFVGGNGGKGATAGGNGSNISNYLLDLTIKNILTTYEKTLCTSLRFGQGGGGGWISYSGQGGNLDNAGGSTSIIPGYVGGNGLATNGGNGGGGSGIPISNFFGQGITSYGGSGSDGTAVVWFKYVQEAPYTPVISVSSYPCRSKSFSNSDITDYSGDSVQITISNNPNYIVYNNYTGSFDNYTYNFTFNAPNYITTSYGVPYTASNSVGSSQNLILCSVINYQQPTLSVTTSTIALHADTTYNLQVSISADINILDATLPNYNQCDFSFSQNGLTYGSIQANNIIIPNTDGNQYLQASYNVGTVSYTPQYAYVGTDNFTIRYTDNTNMYITDNSGSTNDVIINVIVKNPAITSSINISTYSHTITSIDLSGVDLEEYYPLTYYINTLPTNGTLYLGEFPNNPSVLWSLPYQLGVGSSQQTFKLYYVSNEGYTGTDSFTYYVEDKHGLYSIDYLQYSTGTKVKVPSSVQINVNPLTYTPVAYDVSYVVHENIPTTVDFSNNYPASSQINYYIASLPISQYDILTTSNNTVISLEYNNNVCIPVSVNENHTINFVSSSNTLGYTLHSFNYFYVDVSGSISNTATVYIYMVPTPITPQYITMSENDSSISIYLQASGQTEYLYSYYITYPEHGVITSSTGEQISNNTWISSTIDDQQYGYKINYIPNKFYSGTDSFYWAVKYKDDPSDISANVTINISNITPPPIDVTLYISFYQYSDGIITNQRGDNNTDILLFLPNIGLNNYIYTINSKPSFININGQTNITYDLNDNILLDVITSDNFYPIDTIPYNLSNSTVKYNWTGTPFGTSKFYFSVSGYDNNYIYKSYSGEVIVSLQFGKITACDTGPGPIPTRVWTRASGDCPDLSGGIINGQPMTYDDLNEKRKAIIFQYNNNSAGFSKKQLYSRLARGLGKQGKKTYATQSDTYTNANTHNLLLDSSSVLLCPGTIKNWAFTYQNDTPGPPRVIANYPNVPLYNYKTQQKYSSVGNKWPQFGPYPQSKFIPGISYFNQPNSLPEPTPEPESNTVKLIPQNFILVVYDGFDYPTDSNVNGLNGGSGEWSTPWTNSYITDSYLKIGTPGINYNDLSLSGNCITFGSSSNDVAGAKRSFPTQYKGLVYVRILTYFDTNTNGYNDTPRIGFYTNNTPVGFIGNTGNNESKYTTNIYDSTLTLVANTGITLENTKLILLQFNYAINKGRLWVNPELSTFVYDNPDLTNSYDIGHAWVFNTLDIVVRAGTVANYDEITIFEYSHTP